MDNVRKLTTELECGGMGRLVRKGKLVSGNSVLQPPRSSNGRANSEKIWQMGLCL